MKRYAQIFVAKAFPINADDYRNKYSSACGPHPDWHMDGYRVEHEDSSGTYNSFVPKDEFEKRYTQIETILSKLGLLLLRKVVRTRS
jgi:hypothetical protein